ncbi:MFS transporter [Vibrio zhugei]|uniref:MFS transporter n=1 Tax=Vibrio zhugei TaxID=2479546 RepID=A0ABV7CAL6_9VIBR|nr:MFS transporter [Vibrio zhugei]
MNTQILPKISKPALFVLYLIIFLGSAGFFITIPAYVSLFLSNEHSMAIAKAMPLSQRRELFGIVMSAAPFLSMFFTPFIARFADRFNRQWVMIACLAVASLGFVLPVYAIITGSVVLLFAGNMINSIGSASQPIAQAILADNSQGKNKATLMSFVAVVMTAAMSFGPALGSKLLANYGVTGPFYACLLIAVVCGVLLLWIRCPQQVSVPNENPFSLAAPLERSKAGLLKCLWIVFLCQFSWSLYFQNISFIFPQTFHLSLESSQYQYYMMAIGLVMMASLILLPRIVLSWLPLARALKWVLTAAGVGMVLLAWTPTFVIHAVIMVFTAAMVALAFPLYITALSDRASDQDQGWAMALSSAMVGLAWTLTGYLTAIMVNVDVKLPTLVAALGYAVALMLIPRTTTQQLKEAQV